MKTLVARFAFSFTILCPLHAAADIGALLDTRGQYRPTELAGVQSALANGVQTSLSLFRLDLDAEPVLVDDAGGMVEGRPSKRTGIGYFAFYEPNGWTRIDAGLALVRARYSDANAAGARIPGAVQSVASLKLGLRRSGPWSGALELRYFGPRPLVEDNTLRARPMAMLNAGIGVQVTPRLQFALEGVNLAGRRSDPDFHPVGRRSLRIALASSF